MEDETIHISDLEPRSREVNIKVKVVSKNEERSVVSRRDGSTNRVTEALVGDETGSILLTLWNEHIDQINVDDSIEIKNGYCNLFRGSMRLNIGRYGSFEGIEEKIEVNTENNLSDKIYEQERRRRPYGGDSYSGRDRDRRRRRF